MMNRGLQLIVGVTCLAAVSVLAADPPEEAAQLARAAPVAPRIWLPQRQVSPGHAGKLWRQREVGAHRGRRPGLARTPSRLRGELELRQVQGSVHGRKLHG